MTFDKFSNQLDIPGIFEKWSASWKVYGRFQYRSYSGATANHPPLERFNVYEDQIIGDRQNGIVFVDTNATPEELLLVWADNTTYVAQSVIGPFTGTMMNDHLDWGAEKWYVQNLFAGQYSQELIQTGLIQERYSYNWKQEGITQGFFNPYLYGVGLSLYIVGQGGQPRCGQGTVK